MRPEFFDAQWIRYKGRGWGAVVGCDKERDREHTGLVDTIVIVDGERFFCKGVERHMPRSPIRKGELIVLLVEEIK